MIHDRRAPNRLPATWLQSVNPIWLLSDELRDLAWPLAPTAWWLCWWRVLLLIPGVRWLCWFTRNPACNFFSVVVGIAHRTRTVHAENGIGWTFTDGWNKGWIKADESNLALPFRAYRGRFIFWQIEGIIGWKTSGGFGLSLRRANSTGPGTHP